MKTYFTAILFGIFAITACAREVDVEPTTSLEVHKSTKPHSVVVSTKTYDAETSTKKVHTSAVTTTLVSKKSTSSVVKSKTTTSITPRPTCDVRMFRIDCPEVPDLCCTRLCLDSSSSSYFCADDWEDVGEGIQCESCVQSTTTSSAGPTATGKSYNTTGATTTSSLPEPTFSSEASSGAPGLRMGSAAVLGALGLLLAI
ncbi:hypothetical protein TWF730_002456 [Orbilia blumenaviensis]|uniref:Uncharacterized protein n=1 Tax=Orbilia blumenaviensis TaxID=1796055 RepID=A0AAV9UA80_9PEZI